VSLLGFFLADFWKIPWFWSFEAFLRCFGMRVLDNFMYYRCVSGTHQIELNMSWELAAALEQCPCCNILPCYSSQAPPKGFRPKAQPQDETRWGCFLEKGSKFIHIYSCCVRDCPGSLDEGWRGSGPAPAAAAIWAGLVLCVCRVQGTGCV